jgi:AI-2 transport protein TqsA
MTPNETPRWASIETLRMGAYAVIIAAGSWYLLGQLASVLRPLLLAAFLGYVLMPYYNRLRRHVPVPVAIVTLVGGTTLVLLGLVAVITGNLYDLTEQGPKLQSKVFAWTYRISDWVYSLPMVGPKADGTRPPEKLVADTITDGLLKMLDFVRVGLPEAFAAGLYLLFLLLESTRFPERVRRAYPEERADRILDIFGRINAAIISYLKAKVKSSLMLALPVGLLLIAFDVPFALLWTALTFVCNFIPYIGTVVAYSLPVVFAFVEFDAGARAIALAIVLLAFHIISATLIEPMWIGRAVGLSPLVILAALSMWGLLWGLPGMFLAVPLTVVLKIAFENVEITRPLGRMLSGE